MDKKEDKQYTQDIIDTDLYEEFDEEELLELVEAARKEALEKARKREEENIAAVRLPKWFIWLVAAMLVLNVVALLPQTFSIPAVDFLITSAKLSTQADIKTYKKAVVVIETEDSKGTGFAINKDGDIVTNYHVIEGEDTVTVTFAEEGFFVGTVTETYPDIDLAVVQIEADKAMPYLSLADGFTLKEEEPVYFIGNPLQFQRIANQGEVLDFITMQGKSGPVVMLDAPVYKGNSGSPVINADGEVIGVIYATFTHDTEGKLGLFIPIDYLYDKRTP